MSADIHSASAEALNWPPASRIEEAKDLLDEDLVRGLAHLATLVGDAAGVSRAGVPRGEAHPVVEQVLASLVGDDLSAEGSPGALTTAAPGLIGSAAAAQLVIAELIAIKYGLVLTPMPDGNA